METTAEISPQIDELQSTSKKSEVQLELQIQKKRVKELETILQEMKQLEETRKTSSLVSG